MTVVGTWGLGSIFVIGRLRQWNSRSYLRFEYMMSCWAFVVWFNSTRDMFLLYQNGIFDSFILIVSGLW